MEVETISKECIKPCSSTPSHLRIYKVSLLDQFMPPSFTPHVLYYPNNHPNLIPQNTSLVLKNSLSKTLSHFYPVAGRIKDYVSIDCNDEGVYYTKAKANISMSEYLIQPDLSLLQSKLLPNVSFFNQYPIGGPLVFIQETTFSCGGLVIGLYLSHILFDGPSIGFFIKSWASRASSSENIPYPDLDTRSLFPMYEHGDFPKEALFPALWAPFSVKDKISLNRLVFYAPAIAKLKAKARSSSGVENPTKFVVVSAIITKSVKAALNAKSGINKPIAISLSVNMRRKATPPLPDSSLGNFIWPAQAIHKNEAIELSSLVYDLRNAIRKVDNEFVKNAIESGPSKLLKDIKEMGDLLSVDEMELMLFSSVCNYGLYNKFNFGFGKPIWIGLCTMPNSPEEIVPFNNMSVLNDTRNGDGVEAWLLLPPNIACVVEKDDELLQYASFNPSPLNIPFRCSL